MTDVIRRMLKAPHGRPAALQEDPLDKRCDCAVSLIDRRSGQIPNINGRPVMVVTRDPAKAVAELMQGRDRRIWDVRIQALEPGLS